MRLVSLVGRVCSSGAQKEAKNSTTVWSVSSLDTPSSAPMKSWLVVARSASAPLRLVGHLGWVHQHEARPVGEPRERMGGRQRAEIGGRDLAVFEKHEAPRGGASMLHHRFVHKWGRCPLSFSARGGPKMTVRLVPFHSDTLILKTSPTELRVASSALPRAPSTADAPRKRGHLATARATQLVDIVR